MCGIVGVINFEPDRVATAKRESFTDWFTSALFVDQLRGKDSTGIFSVDKDTKEVLLYKRALAAADFLQLGNTRKLLDKADTARLLVGHNRFATKGAVTDENAHPFKYEHITMVHNGTIDDHTSMKTWTIGRTDSEAFTMSVAELGFEKAIEETPTGAFSLVWYDDNNKTINLYRNKDRPLYLVEFKYHQAYLFASEAWMARDLANRILGYTTESPESLKESEWVQIPFNEKDHTKWERKIVKKSVKYPAVHHQKGAGSGSGGVGSSFRGRSAGIFSNKELGLYGVQKGDSIEFMISRKFRPYSGANTFEYSGMVIDPDSTIDSVVVTCSEVDIPIHSFASGHLYGIEVGADGTLIGLVNCIRKVVGEAPPKEEVGAVTCTLCSKELSPPNSKIIYAPTKEPLCEKCAVELNYSKGAI